MLGAKMNCLLGPKGLFCQSIFLQFVFREANQINGHPKLNVSSHHHIQYMDVSANRHTPKSSILIGFSIINHPFWGTPIFGNTHIYIYIYICPLVACRCGKFRKGRGILQTDPTRRHMCQTARGV